MIIDGVEYVRADEIERDWKREQQELEAEIERLKQIYGDPPAPISEDDPPYGGVMLVETVTKFFVGEVVSVHPQEIVLRNACWIADTGRWHKFLIGETDDKAEFEPCPDGLAIIGRGSIVDATPYNHGLIRVVK